MINRRKILVFIAHPDDELYCSGTIAKLTAGGDEVVFVVGTNGNKGTHDRNTTPEQISNIRFKEMQQVANILGASKIIWFGFDDGTLIHCSELKEKVYRTIRTEKPDIVLTFDGWKRWEVHSDHRALGLTVAEVAYLADGYRFFPEHLDEGIEPTKPQETYLFNPDEANYWVDIRETFEIKLKAANAHKSQSSPEASLGERYLNSMRLQFKDESDIYREGFRKLYDTDLLI